jgi:hypothetical protein
MIYWHIAPFAAANQERQRGSPQMARTTPPIRRISHAAGNSPVARDCVVVSEGLKLRAGHAVRANRSLEHDSRQKPRNSASFPYGSRCRAGKQVASVGHVVPKGPVAGLSPAGHFGQQGFVGIDVVVDNDLQLGRMQPVKLARIRKGPAPGYLRGVLTLYSLYYNETRTHLGLAKDAPLGRAVERSGTSITTPILSGLHHRYTRI